MAINMVIGGSPSPNDGTNGSIISSAAYRVPSSFEIPISCSSSILGIS